MNKNSGPSSPAIVRTTPTWEPTDILCPICGQRQVERYGNDNLMSIMENGEIILIIPMRRCTNCTMVLHMYEEEVK